MMTIPYIPNFTVPPVLPNPGAEEFAAREVVLDAALMALPEVFAAHVQCELIKLRKVQAPYDLPKLVLSDE